MIHDTFFGADLIQTSIVRAQIQRMRPRWLRFNQKDFFSGFSISRRAS